MGLHSKNDFSKERELHRRRLPVYLLLDCSASMAGAPLEAVNEGVNTLFQQLQEAHTPLTTVWISIISFGTYAKQIIPLSPLSYFHPPQLSAGGATSLGAALQLLNQALVHDLQSSSSQVASDWRPLVFLLTDGEPTDDWKPKARNIKKLTASKLGNFVAFACGDTINTDTLYQMTDHVVMLADVSNDQINTFFKWVSQDIERASDINLNVDDMSRKIQALL